MFCAIALVDRYGGIAKDGKQPIFIQDDLKHFRELTEGHAVIYGRKTYEQMGLLPNRQNYILSRTMEHSEDLRLEGEKKSAPVYIYRSVHELVNELLNGDGIYFVIGGGQIYEQLFPFCVVLYLTEVQEDFNCDVFFPGVSIFEWALISEKMFGDPLTGLQYHFTTYIRK